MPGNLGRESPDRRSRMPPTALLSPSWSPGEKAVFRETCGGPQACKAGKATFQEGKWKSESVGSLSRQDRERKRSGGRRWQVAKSERVREKGALCWRGRKGERGFQEYRAIRSVLGLHIYTVEGVHRWALN